MIKNDEINKSSKFVIYETDIRLLKLILKGPRFAHWNNTEIGSLLSLQEILMSGNQWYTKV